MAIEKNMNKCNYIAVFTQPLEYEIGLKNGSKKHSVGS